MSKPQYRPGTVSILLRMQTEDRDRITQAAASLGVTTSDFCRDIIMERVEMIERLAGTKPDQK